MDPLIGNDRDGVVSGPPAFAHLDGGSGHLERHVDRPLFANLKLAVTSRLEGFQPCRRAVDIAERRTSDLIRIPTVLRSRHKERGLRLYEGYGMVMSYVRA